MRRLCSGTLRDRLGPLELEGDAQNVEPVPPMKMAIRLTVDGFTVIATYSDPAAVCSPPGSQRPVDEDHPITVCAWV